MKRWKNLLVATIVVTSGLSVPAGADEGPPLSTPGVPCRRGDHPEKTQGRAPARDYASGRATLGYTCNTTEVGHIGKTGGFRTHRYIDEHGRVCAFWDSTLWFPVQTALNATSVTPDELGVWVMDMSDPTHPVHTDTLRTPAMQTPHESLSLNVERGLLAAVLGWGVTYPGVFDVYDVSEDCRHPRLRASLPVGGLGHEGEFSPDGKTYYSSSPGSRSLTAIDVTDPDRPATVWVSTQWAIHGLNLSNDGNTLYGAAYGNAAIPSQEIVFRPGLVVLDVSQVQTRVATPTVAEIGFVTWPEVNQPQTTLPVTIKRRPYVIEIDEYGAGGDPGPVGAARIIDITDPTEPRVVSNIRLRVHNDPTDPDLLSDPGADRWLGALAVQGYSGHYCGVPSRRDPGIVACSFVASGLRVFDIRDPRRPREIAYFNRPQTQPRTPEGEPQGAFAMSQPAFDVARGHIWYTDVNSGFYVVRVNSALWPRRQRRPR